MNQQPSPPVNSATTLLRGYGAKSGLMRPNVGEMISVANLLHTNEYGIIVLIRDRQNSSPGVECRAQVAFVDDVW